MLWVGLSALQAPPCSALHHGCRAGQLHPSGKMLGRWVLWEGIASVSYCINFGSGFGNDFPWFNCSDNCLFTISIYRAFIEAKQTYALCHCHGVRKVADTSFPTLPFIVQKLLEKLERATCQLHCLAWIHLVMLQPFIFREFYLSMM